MPKIYKDDEMKIIRSDIEKMKARPTMYIASLGDNGCLHLCKEVIDNNRDECSKTESPGNMITIEATPEYLMSRDNGRGIATKILREVLETNQAGSNMTREHGDTAGENGTGTTAVIAMSAYTKIISLRPGEKKRMTLVYKDGKCVEEKVEPYKEKDSGLITVFKPSKKILGVDKIPITMLHEWLMDFDYTLPTTTDMTYKLNGEEFHVKHQSLAQYFDKFISPEERMSEPITIQASGKLREEYDELSWDRHFTVEAAIMYSQPSYRGDDIRKSWMNMIYTSQNGAHVNGVVNGLARYLNERVCKRNKRFEDEDLKRDILAHLHVVVKATCNFAHMFSSQAKSTVFPRAIAIGISNAVYEALCNMNQAKLNDLVDIVIQNNRVRKEGEKVRNLTTESRKKSWIKPDEYLPASSVKTPQAKELFICEGKSARGGLDSARDAKYQAILMCSGKPPVVWEMTLDQALKNPVWYRFVNILGAGIGDSFDIKKLRFGKIIISTDADIDGYHIRTIILTFILKFMPELFEAGVVYIAEPPLYKLMADRKVTYVASQTEYIDECIKAVGNIKLNFPEKDLIAYPAKTFIRDAFTYLETLDTISVDRSINRYLLEHIAHGFVKYGSVEGFIENANIWIRDLCKTFPELRFDDDTNQIIATIDYVDQVVIVDDSLYVALYDIIEILSKYGLLVEYDGAGVVTVCRFFEIIQKKYPTIKERYKGLGSSDATVSREIVMRPETRRIFRVDASDPNVMGSMAMLVGKRKEDIAARKEMIEQYRWVPSDIDT